MAARRLISLLAIALLSFATRTRAGETVFESGQAKVHLLELFTSEGCSSCPPAEAWLSRLKQSDRLWRDFVPLAFHVDYWDRLGWRDRFASKDWTQRQQVYAARWKGESVYTPGFVLDGVEASAQVPRSSSENIGTLRLKIDGDEASVSFKPAKADPPSYEICVATLGFGLASNVAAGENSGRKLSHDFVVLSLQKAQIPADLSEVKFKIDKLHPEKTGAVVAWIVREGDPTPLQATGGWLSN